MSRHPRTTFTELHLEPGARFWAFRQMGLLGRSLRGVAGLRFWKLMGTGRRFGGVAPDWDRYALLGVWDGEPEARAFWEAPAMRRYRARVARSVTHSLEAVRATGSWDGQQPFGQGSEERPGATIAVLTRATLRPSRQLAFWRHGDAVEPEIARAPGLIRALSIGELPMLRSGTFSLWRSADAIAAFAGEPAHRAAMRARSAEGLYREELFCRFNVLDTRTDGAEG